MDRRDVRQDDYYAYDGNGNILSSKEGNGALEKFAYDEMNRVKEKRVIVDPNDPSTDIVITYSYDGNGNVTAITDPRGNATHMEYDLHDRLVKKTYPDGTYATYSYDKAGNVTETDSYSASGTLVSKSTAAYDLL